MKIHLISGFLGSGKTTAISNAAQQLIGSKIKTSVITNDQGESLVDSEFVKSLDIPNLDVVGGCFCCNYDQLSSQIDSLIKDENPEVIFAESVGSCTDMVATVLKPLLKYKEELFDDLTFSTFVDGRLMLNDLKSGNNPFDSDTAYIWKKQLEEAEILIINKVDLLDSSDLDFIKSNVDKKYPNKTLVFQNSLDDDSLQQWISILNSDNNVKEHQTIEVDYDIYGSGEAKLGWLDEKIVFSTTDNSVLKVAYNFVILLESYIASKEYAIGHLKFLFSYNDKKHKLSYTTVNDENDLVFDISEKCNSVELIVNARVQTSPTILRNIVTKAIRQITDNKSVDIVESDVAFFEPGFPEPTHRVV